MKKDPKNNRKDTQTAAPEPISTNLSRRAFLGGATGIALVNAVGLGGCGKKSAPSERTAAAQKTVVDKKSTQTAGAAEPKVAAPATDSDRTTVVLVRHKDVLGPGRKPKADILGQMLDEAVAELTGKPASEAWKSFVSPRDIVGIKSNEWQFLPTPPELESHIQTRLEESGVKTDAIAIADRAAADHPIFEKATALINVRPMRTHHWSGVGSMIKNYIIFSKTPLPSWHGDSCADLGGLWNLPHIKGKTRLNILVMLTPLFHGKGPHHYQAEYTWPYNGLIVGTDPVAVDATGLKILTAKRKAHFGNDDPLTVSPKHIAMAETRHKIGIADPKRIDIKRIGWQEEALI